MSLEEEESSEHVCGYIDTMESSSKGGVLSRVAMDALPTFYTGNVPLFDIQPEVKFANDAREENWCLRSPRHLESLAGSRAGAQLLARPIHATSLASHGTPPRPP